MKELVDRQTENCRDIWSELFGDPPVKGSLQRVENKNGKIIKIIEVRTKNLKISTRCVPERLRSQPRETKAEAASRESSDMDSGTPSTQADNEPAEHNNIKTGGGSSTAENEPPPNHQSLPVVGNRQVHVNGSMADNEPAEHTNPQTGGGSSTAQNEPPPNHQSLPVVSDHQVHNVQVNGSMADNESAEHTNPQTEGVSSTAQNEPPPNHEDPLVGGDHEVHNLQVNGSMSQTVNYPPESSDMESGTPSTQADNEPARDKCGHESMFMVLWETILIVLAAKSAKKSADFRPSQDFQDTVSKINLWTSLAFIWAPMLLDQEFYRDRNSVSYKMFAAFMICVIFSFSGAFSVLLIRSKPELANLRRCYFWFSIVSMASALSILGYALFWKV